MITVTRRFWSFAAIVTALTWLIAGTPASAIVMLDQSYDARGSSPTGVSATRLSSTRSLAQGVTAGLDGLLTRVDLQLLLPPAFLGAADSDALLTIIEIAGGLPSGTNLGSVPIPIIDVPGCGCTMNTGDAVSLDVSTLNIMLEAGDMFALVVTYSGMGNYTWARSGLNPPTTYPGGVPYVRDDPSGSFTVSTLNDSDFGFRTFVDDGVVPLPPSAFLLLGAFALVAGISSAKRRKTAV